MASGSDNTFGVKWSKFSTKCMMTFLLPPRHTDAHTIVTISEFQGLDHSWVQTQKMNTCTCGDMLLKKRKNSSGKTVRIKCKMHRIRLVLLALIKLDVAISMAAPGAKQ